MRFVHLRFETLIGCGTVAKKKATGIYVEDILQDFAELPDPRSHVNQRHLLGDIIVISITAVIVGAEGPKRSACGPRAMKPG